MIFLLRVTGIMCFVNSLVCCCHDYKALTGELSKHPRVSVLLTGFLIEIKGYESTPIVLSKINLVWMFEFSDKTYLLQDILYTLPGLTNLSGSVNL